MSKKTKKLTKNLAKLDYYCLGKYGFSIFSEEIQEMLGVKASLSRHLRATSVGRKMSFVLQDKKLSKKLTQVFMYIQPD